MPDPTSATAPPQAIALPPGAVVPLPARHLPMFGLTLLAVEDSRFASEALRLMARRAGARLRRAETIEAARAHLRLYRPDVVLVDLGLPDGRGEGLIRELVLSHPRPATVLGMSGLDDGRALALAAGADGFLPKPIAGFRTFCQALVRGPNVAALPEDTEEGVFDLSSPLPKPDPLALHDDLEAALARLDQAGMDAPTRRYVAGFVEGVARATRDPGLMAAGRAAARSDTGLGPLRVLLGERLAAQGVPIAPRNEDPFTGG